MKILIDLQSCQSGSRMGGIGRYSMSLAKAMIRQGEGHDFFVLLNRTLPAVHEVRDQLRCLLPQHRILTFDIPPGVAEVHDQLPKTRLAELIRERFIADLRPDVVHVSSLVEGLGDDVVTSVGKIFPAERTAVTLYDLIPLVDKERYLTNHVLSKHYLGKIEHFRQAGMLLAISEYSRLEAIKRGGFPSERIVNISSAVDGMFRQRAVSKERREALSGQYGIRRKFLMFTGSFDSRKNHSRLIEAFAQLPATVRDEYQLVIVGHGWAGVYEHLRSIGRSFGLAGESLVFPGHVDDETLLDIYNQCSLFVFPSLSEGFGLPVLEAMSCGVPTIGSNTTSIPEVLGRADALFDPFDCASISQKMLTALTDHDFRDTLRRHALEHAQNFSWDISARKALDFIATKIRTPHEIHKLSTSDDNYGNTHYQQLIAEASHISNAGSLPDNFLLSTANALAINEITANPLLPTKVSLLKTGWVSTWNTRCGIASYTHHLVDNSSGSSVIFAPVEQTLLAPDGAEVVRCWSLYMDTLTGLNKAIDQSGVDVVAIQMNYGFFDLNALNALIFKQKQNGRVVTITLHATIDPPLHILNRRLTDLAPALHACDAVLVHSLADITRLEAIGVTENVCFFPQGAICLEIPLPPARKIGGGFCIGTYGFALPHKGLEQIIAAIAALRADNIDVRLEMINAAYPAATSASLIQKCRAQIATLGLLDRVNLVTDYLDEQDSLQRLARTDLVVFPYQETGESSSAAVRMALAAGPLVAVTPLSIFSDVSDLVFQLPGTTPESLAQGIRLVIAMIKKNEQSLAVLRENSQRWVENNHFSHLATYYSHLIFSKNMVHAEALLMIRGNEQ